MGMAHIVMVLAEAAEAEAAEKAAAEKVVVGVLIWLKAEHNQQRTLLRQ